MADAIIGLEISNSIDICETEQEGFRMKKIHFDVDTDGFYGAYWECKTASNCAMIAMIGDDPEDYLARSSVRWLHKLGVNVMTMSPAKKDYGHHNYPLERIERAICRSAISIRITGM